MMHVVYVLYSRKHDKMYIGETGNLLSRFKSHNELGKKDWTKRYRPWMVAHIEHFDSRMEALKREKMLKGGQGRNWIQDTVLPELLRLIPA